MKATLEDLASACYAPRASRVNGGHTKRPLFRALALLVALGLVGSPALAEPPDSGEDRWAPSIAVNGGFSFQQAHSRQINPDGSVEPGIESRDVSNDTALKPDVYGTTWAVSPYVGGNVELMTPRLGRRAWSPRFFVAGEALAVFSPALDIAKDGDPKGFDPPDALENGQPFEEDAITGTGSRLTVQVDTLMWSAALGMAFPFELFGRQLRIKPSVGWLRYKVNLSGVVLRAIKPDKFDPFYREVTLSAEGALALDAIGPGLELEMDVKPRGPIRPSLYLDVKGYNVIGDQTIEITDTVEITDQLGGPDEYTASWRYEISPWIVRVGLGVRLRWPVK